MNKRPFAIALAFVVFAGAVLAAGCAPSLSSPCVDTAQQAIVERVVDGDTIVVVFDGKSEKVRLIGIDCPESVASDTSRNCEEGKIASDFTKGLLPKGTKVWLSKEESDSDKYGRLLRHVWISDPTEAAGEEFARENLVEAIIVSAGMAQAKAYEPDTAYHSFLSALGKEASDKGEGVSYKWSRSSSSGS